MILGVENYNLSEVIGSFGEGIYADTFPVWWSDSDLTIVKGIGLNCRSIDIQRRVKFLSLCWYFYISISSPGAEVGTT